MNTISIVITCYNGFRYMDRCLSALESQGVTPDEIIIVDDASTDDSFANLEKYRADSTLNIKLFRNETNAGPGVSRKVGIENATMEYVAFCDCDDWYETNFLEKIKEKIAAEHADLYLFDNYTAYDDGTRVKENVTEHLLSASKKELIALYSMSLCRLVVRRNVLAEIEHSELYYSEDMVVAIQAIHTAEKISVLKEAYYNYYLRRDSASNKPSPKVFQSFIKAYEIVSRKVGEQYRDELEFLGIKNLCYGATLNGFKTGIPKRDIKNMLNAFEESYANWMGNKYRHSLGRIKNCYLFLIHKRWLAGAKMMARLHMLAVSLKKKK